MGPIRTPISKTGFLLANFRHAGLTVSGRDIAGDDLYETFPADIRRMSSLHVIVIPSTIRMLEIYRELRNRDAGIWCVPEGNIGKCISDVKLYLAWFTRPTILGTVLGDSPPEFSEVLLRSFRMLIMSELNAAYPWSIYAKPATEFSLSTDGKRITTV